MFPQYNLIRGRDYFMFPQYNLIRGRDYIVYVMLIALCVERVYILPAEPSLCVERVNITHEKERRKRIATLSIIIFIAYNLASRFFL